MTDYRDMAYDVLATGFQFCEAPRQDDEGNVYFSDLTGGGLYRVTPGGAVETVLPDRIWIGGSVIDADGAILVSGAGGIVRVDPATGATSPVLTEINGVPVLAVNDFEADDRGGIFGGTIDFPAIMERGEAPAPGVFFHLSPEGRVTIIREGVIASNGIDYSPDRKTLYHSECTVGVWAYDLDAGGMPQNPRIFAAMDDSDGLVVDSAGAIWVARWSAGEVIRFLPDGSEDFRFKLPFPNLVSLSFGGADLRDLYITTGGAADGDGPPLGGLVRVRTAVPGQRAAKSRMRR